MHSWTSLVFAINTFFIKCVIPWCVHCITKDKEGVMLLSIAFFSSFLAKRIDYFLTLLKFSEQRESFSWNISLFSGNNFVSSSLKCSASVYLQIRSFPIPIKTFGCKKVVPFILKLRLRNTSCRWKWLVLHSLKIFYGL